MDLNTLKCSHLTPVILKGFAEGLFVLCCRLIGRTLRMCSFDKAASLSTTTSPLTSAISSRRICGLNRSRPLPLRRPSSTARSSFTVQSARPPSSRHSTPSQTQPSYTSPSVSSISRSLGFAVSMCTCLVKPGLHAK